MLRAPHLRRAIFLALAAVAPVAAPAYAAEVTEVADAADGDDPFDANLDVRVEYTYQHALLTRENTQVPGGETKARSINVREMDYTRHTARLLPRLEVGMFHDLAVFVEWPIIMWDQQGYGFTAGTTATNSTVARDMANPPTITDWEEAIWGVPGAQRNQGYADWQFNIDQNGKYEKIRSGFDYPVVGIRWSPVNNSRDDTKPTITIQADYKVAFLPLPIALDPDDPQGEVSYFAADGSHRFHGLVAMSKRFSLLDPYFVADYTFPFASSEAVLGLEPRHDVGFILGMEIVPYENTELNQKFALDFSFTTRYFSPGRDYSEMSDPLGELTYTDEFMRMGGSAKLLFRAFDLLYFDVVGSILYDTPHYLTTEVVGCDGGCSGPGLLTRLVGASSSGVQDGQISLDPAAGERNDYFNPVVDTPGRRFRVEESIRFQVIAHAALTF